MQLRFQLLAEQIAVHLHYQAIPPAQAILPLTTHLPTNQNLTYRHFNTSDIYRISASEKRKDSRIYYGNCETKFKSRYNNHTYSFRHPHKSNATELSNFYWSFVNKGSNSMVKWSMKKKSTPYQMGRRRYN